MIVLRPLLRELKNTVLFVLALAVKETSFRRLNLEAVATEVLVAVRHLD
jgi:hypothetical protein